MARRRISLLSRNRRRTLDLRPAVGRRLGIWVSLGLTMALAGGYLVYQRVQTTSVHFALLRGYWADPAGHAEWAMIAGARCGEAPFLQPTDGFVAFFWGDRYLSGRRHQGIDIFGPTGPDGLGQTPVVASHDGYLTRLPEWRSAVIIRIPRDPLQPNRQIWAYYAHMADGEGKSFLDDDFPAGTFEKPVRAGTLLGYQGNYSGEPESPTGMHLHFSIVRDDGQGQFLNELDIGNTQDPTPYLGIESSFDRIGDRVATCEAGP